MRRTPCRICESRRQRPKSPLRCSDRRVARDALIQRCAEFGVQRDDVSGSQTVEFAGINGTAGHAMQIASIVESERVPKPLAQNALRQREHLIRGSAGESDSNISNWVSVIDF